jgi:vacuolar-type H+-ATPase subunit I/STV1
MESMETSGVTASGEDLRNKLSEKIAELEEMQKNQKSHTADEIKTKLEEVNKLQKELEEYYETIQKDNNEKKKALDELRAKTKQMKELKNAVDKAYGVKEELTKSDIKKGIYRKPRTHKNYDLSLDHKALKNLEGTPQRSFLALAKGVIRIDGEPYNPNELTLSTVRKKEFRELIEHFAMLEFTGERKCCVRKVYTKKQREELNELKFIPAENKPAE